MTSLPALAARPTVRGQVIDALRAAVITGQMMPGTIYSAPALAAQFGVSATPVREAMLQLAKEGLVTTVRNRGFQIREPSERELDEVTEIRLLVEVPATLKAAQNLRPADAASLRALAQQIVDCAGEKDLIGYIEHDRRFHLTLLAACGNRQLVTIVGELRDRSRLYGLQQLSERGELVSSAAEHLQLVDVIDRGDLAELERRMRTHIGHVRGKWAGPAH
jgi:DNA-binding GntR family transcriptional regulator